MTVPATPQSKWRKALAWAVSAEGRKDIGAVIAAVTAIYTALHRSGL